MTSSIAISYAKQGLNKQDTATNPNFRDWDFEDAFNKAVSNWVRKAYNGRTVTKEGKEESISRIDDLDVLLITGKEISFANKNLYVETVLPEDYRYFSRLSPITSKNTCLNIQLTSTLVENANVDVYLKDWNTAPSFDFEQCFHTLSNNRIQLYHNNDFEVNKLYLSYYRNPIKISCDKIDYDKEWEWNDDIAHLIIDEAIKLLAGNTENITAYQISNQRTELLN
jgi:hypothetical protein